MELIKDVSNRFIQFFEYGKSSNKYKNAAEFCKIVNVTPQTLTEIVKGRSNVGVSLIQNTLINFPELNPKWIFLGVGDMILPPEEAFDRKMNFDRDKLLKKYEDDEKHRNSLIELYIEKIERLENQIKSLGAIPVT